MGWCFWVTPSGRLVDKLYESTLTTLERFEGQPSTETASALMEVFVNWMEDDGDGVQYLFQVDYHGNA